MRNYIIDLEADNLLMEATKIHCIVLKDIDTGEVFPFGPSQIELALEAIKNANRLIGHNIILYDLPLIQRLYGLQFLEKDIVDTLLWSRLLRPDRDGGHSLDAWGQRLGFLKGKFTDFSQFSEEMLDYCIQDVQVSHKLYNHLSNSIQLYPIAGRVEHDFAEIISQQILSGFQLDIEFTQNLLKELQDEYENIYTRLVDIIPRQHRTGHYETTKKAGKILSESDIEYTYTTGQDKIKTKKFEWIDGNPRSRQQIITFFEQKYNWKAEKTTDKGNAQIDESVLAELDYPEAKLVSRLFRLNKQISMIGPDSGWLSYARNGRVHGGMITNGAVTGRCTHSKPNLAQCDKKDIRMRECWTARPGWVLVSADAEQLEARVLAHFLARYDNGAMTHTLLEGDFHTQNQVACQFADRKSAKTLLYGFIYGAANGKLGQIAMQDPNYASYRGNPWGLGEKMRQALIDSVTGIDKLQQMIALTLAQRDHLLSFDGRPIYVRSPHAALNTLLQGGGAVIMKMVLIDWYHKVKELDYVHGMDFSLSANVHDEVVFECKEEFADRLGKLFQNSMHNVAQSLDLKCPLDAAYSIGNNWGQIH